MKREFLRLAWRTLTSWRRATSDPPAERPGSDGQWRTWPRIRVADYYPNPQTQQDEDDRRSTP